MPADERPAKTRSKKVHPIPRGHHAVAPHLIVRGARTAIAFYQRAFGAEELSRMPAPDGRILHAELRIGDAVFSLCDEFGDALRSPHALGGTSVVVHLWVENVDAVFAEAIEAGSKVLMPVADMFWGDRQGKVKDPFGHEWSIATRVEDLKPEEIARRAEGHLGEDGTFDGL